jgi:hypothetical protein
LHVFSTIRDGGSSKAGGGAAQQHLFLKKWAEDSNSFKSDPPNAYCLSFLGEGTVSVPTTPDYLAPGIDPTKMPALI